MDLVLIQEYLLTEFNISEIVITDAGGNEEHIWVEFKYTIGEDKYFTRKIHKVITMKDFNKWLVIRDRRKKIDKIWGTLYQNK